MGVCATFDNRALQLCEHQANANPQLSHRTDAKRLVLQRGRSHLYYNCTMPRPYAKHSTRMVHSVIAPFLLQLSMGSSAERAILSL